MEKDGRMKALLMGKARSAIAPTAVVLAVSFFYGATLRAGHDWGGDFALYILHAKNIAEGRAYAATPFVYNPHAPSHSPKAYPPVYPLILALPYSLWNLDYRAFKLVNLGFFAGALWALYLFARARLDAPHSVMLILLTGLAPIFWELKDQVLPDVPYLCVTLITLVCVRFFYSHGWVIRRPWAAGAVAGTLAAAAYGLRAIGLVMVLAIVVYGLVEFRKAWQFLIAVCGIFALWAFLFAYLGYGNGSYLAQLRFMPLATARAYLQAWGYIFYTGYGPAKLQYVLAAPVALLAARGFYRRLRQMAEPAEAYVLLYMALLLIWSTGYGVRYLAPILPLLLCYVFEDFQRRRKKWVTAIVLGTICLSFALRYTTLPFGKPMDGVLNLEFQRMAAYVRSTAGTSDTYLFWNPRVLALYTGAKAACFSDPGQHDNEAFYKGLGVSHMVYGGGGTESPSSANATGCEYMTQSYQVCRIR